MINNAVYLVMIGLAECRCFIDVHEIKALVRGRKVGENIQIRLMMDGNLFPIGTGAYTENKQDNE